MKHVACRATMVTVLLCALPAPGMSQDTRPERVFVPYEAYDDAQRGAHKQRLLLEGGCSEEAVEAMLDHGARTGYLFSAANVVRVFPTIFDSDRLNIGCLEPEVRMEFLSVMSTNTLMVKTVSCIPRQDGMACTRPVESQRRFLIDPSKNFELSPDVRFETARGIIEWFRHDAGGHLSDEQKERVRRLSWRAAIGRDDGAYTLRVGDPYCECVVNFELDAADVDAGRNAIALIAAPEFACPGQREGMAVSRPAGR